MSVHQYSLVTYYKGDILKVAGLIDCTVNITISNNDLPPPTMMDDVEATYSTIRVVKGMPHSTTVRVVKGTPNVS
jgi:hypothetical protein